MPIHRCSTYRLEHLCSTCRGVGKADYIESACTNTYHTLAIDCRQRLNTSACHIVYGDTHVSAAGVIAYALLAATNLTLRNIERLNTCSPARLKHISVKLLYLHIARSKRRGLYA